MCKGTVTVKTNRHHPLLDRFYLHYLDNEDSAAFITATSRHYTLATLERLALQGQRLTRRGAVLAVGFLGDYASNGVLGRALHDSDRVVRVLAENGIFELWCRDGSEAQRREVRIILRLNNAYQFEEARDRADRLLEQAPAFAEIWNQRAISYFRQGHYEEAASDCRQAMELNPYHFGAAVGIAHCYLETGEGFAALKWFRRALDLNPNLDAVRGQIEFLQRALEET
jgi:tetratricopeptide (TPR) repeat protein